MKPVTQQAHELLAARVQGTLAIDATVGNGHDTEFLAQLVGPLGTVWAFDIQPLALIRTAARMKEQQINCEMRLRTGSEPVPLDRRSQVLCIEADHSEMADYLPEESRGQISAVMFNLGYLPGADKSCITTTRSTLAALEYSLEWLAPGGVLSVVVYPGHPGGQEEADAVRAWFERQTSHGSATWLAGSIALPQSGPQLLAIERPSSS